MKEERSKGIWDWGLVRLIVFGSLILFVSFVGIVGFTEEGWRLVIRWSARLAAICFSISFMASAFHQWMKNSFSFWVLMNRKYWGISFAILHLVHLSSLFVLQYVFHPVFTLAAKTSLMAGGLAYVFLVLMLLTSFERFSKYLTRKEWKILHTVGGYWIWFIFFNSYRKGVMKGEYYDFPMFILLVIVLLLRVWLLWRKKKKGQSFI